MAWYDEFNPVKKLPIGSKNMGGGTSIQPSAASAATSGGGGFFGKMLGGAKGSMSPEEKLFGFGDSHQREADKEAKRLRDEWQDKGADIEKRYGAADTDLSSKMQASVDQRKSEMSNDYTQLLSDKQEMRNALEEQHKNSAATYSNDIQPRMKDMMERSQKNSASAMSLEDYMNPNNKVAQQTRQLYENQAQGENRQGLANAGILSAMGMQNMAGQLGGMPMTGGQLQALMGANQAQSGTAYANTQRRVQNLRDQGLDRGFQQSDKAYAAGLDAQDRYRRSVGDYEGAFDRNQGREAAYRKEFGDRSQSTLDAKNQWGNDVFNLDSGMSDLSHKLATGGLTREEARNNRYYGGGIEAQMGKASRADAENARKQQLLGGGIQGLFGMLGGGGGGGGGAPNAHGSGGPSTGYSQNETEQQPNDVAQNYDQGRSDNWGGDETTGGYQSDPNQDNPYSGMSLTGMMSPYGRRRYV